MKNLSFGKRFMKFFGFRYLINNNTREVHDLKNNHCNCHVDSISSNNKFYATEVDFKEIKEFYNGCRWCMKENDKG